MGKIYFTVTGTNYYYGDDFLKPGMKVKLIKEPDNIHDKEAIRVEYEGLGKIGYVANSTHTVIGDSRSAGRMYNLMKKKAKGRAAVVTTKGVICMRFAASGGRWCAVQRSRCGYGTVGRR